MKSFQALMFSGFLAILLQTPVGSAEESNNSQFDQSSNIQNNANIEDAILDNGLDNATPTDDLNDLNENNENWLMEDNFDSQFEDNGDGNLSDDVNNEKPENDAVSTMDSPQEESVQEVPDKELLEAADLPVEDFQDPAPAATPFSEDEAPKVAKDLLPPNEFSGAPPIPATIRNLASGEGPEEYYVEPGDTLFDICDQLIDEPAYWPKLWALNPEIKNPHFIYPDMRLAFYSGDEETPPYLQVVAEDDVVPVDKGNLEEDELIEEPIISVSEMMDDDPVEVVGLRDIEVPGDILDGFILAGKIYEGDEVKLIVPGFLYANELDPEGTIIGGRNGGVSSREGDLVLVDNAGGVEPGSTYTVLRYNGLVTNTETDEDVGYRYSFVAHIKMENALEDDAVLGRVTQTRLGVSPGDVVVSYRSTNRVVASPESVGSLAGANANIVGFSYAGQVIGGSGQCAFIDQGSSDGISPGMFLQVYSTPGFFTSGMGDWPMPDSYRPVGFIKIIDTTDVGSVGYIVKTLSELRVGDRVGKG